ncbi:MAG: hypothetical protein IKY67_12160 [Paludibacteraceae bacterium]|nr:hypothetical protein [Paludibacteraceae bacterium]
MNSTIYLFGKFGQGITASVDDYTKSVFKEFISKVNASTQIIIHRSGAIMNYGYVRKIANGHLFGICIQINGQYFSTTKKLFEIFENVVADIAVCGDVLRLNKQGDLESTISYFTDKPDEVERAIANCSNEIAKLSPTCKTLPYVDFSTVDTDINYFNENDNSQTIIKASVKNGYTFIYKEHDYDTLALGSYRSTLSALNKENEAYKKRISEQENKLRILERKKKQMGVVVALFIALFVGSIIFFNTVEEKNEHIIKQETTIGEQREENNALTEDNKELQEQKEKLQSSNHDLVKKQESTNQELENLRLEYGRLKNNYDVLRQENDSYIKEISSLTSKNGTLERNLKKVESDLANKNSAYRTLQSRYDRVSYDLTVMENKYYATKEGKKELKK